MSGRRVDKGVSVELFYVERCYFTNPKWIGLKAKASETKGDFIHKQQTGTKSSRLEKYLPFLDSLFEPSGFQIRVTQRAFVTLP
jgi:hypothetical protein